MNQPLFQALFYQFRLLAARYWFQFFLLLIPIWVLFRHDINFQFSLKAPDENAKKVEQSWSVSPSTSTDEASLLPKGSKNVAKLLPDVSADEVRDFIKKYLVIAKGEGEKYKIPTSIILAQGIVNTQAGANPLAKKANNFFKLRCNEEWVGDIYTAKTGCYRKYPTPKAGFRDHSLFITSGQFAGLKDLGRTAYKAWATALQEQGFQKDKEYADRLILTIEYYQLTDYDE